MATVAAALLRARCAANKDRDWVDEGKGGRLKCLQNFRYCLVAMAYRRRVEGAILRSAHDCASACRLVKAVLAVVSL